MNKYENDDYSRFAGPGYKEARHRNINSDDHIRDEVCETLLKSPDMDATHIAVEVQEGRVVLHGVVPSKFGKRLAEFLIEDIPGVKEVWNCLSVNRDIPYDKGPEAVSRKDLGLS